MSVLTPEVVDLLMNLSCPLEEKTALMKALVRAGEAFQAPALVNGVNDERERLRNENTKAERKRAADRDRMAVKREAERVARLSQPENTSKTNGVAQVARDSRATVASDTRDQPSDMSDSRSDPSRTRVRDNLPRLVSTGLAVAVAERERESDDWPAGNATDHAKLLVEATGSPWLDPSKSLDLVTTTGLIAAWRRDGASWEHDVKPVVLGLTAKRRAAIGSWKFFAGAVAQQIADNRAALQIPEAQVVPLRPGGGASFTDRIAAENAEARRRALAMMEQRNGKPS